MSFRRLLLFVFVLCAGSPGASGSQPDDRVEHLEQLVEQQRKQLLDQQDQISRQLELIESIQAELPSTVKVEKTVDAGPEKVPGVPDLTTMTNSELVKLWQKDRIPLDEFQT